MTQEEFKTRYHYDPAADKLGEGGFGSVFKAYDTYRDRWVALKISKVNPQQEAVRLKKEVEMVNKLPAHPNIAYYEECYTFASFDGEYDFGVLQYYEQGNLAQLLKQGSLPPEQKYSLLTQILAGVEFLHGHGIIHRDLKPQNILMVKRGSEYVPKITDFGISKQLDVNKSSVFSNSIAGAGTLAYASPEQLGDRTIRKNADLWSFGVIAYQALTGALPFTTGEHAVTSEAGRTELFRQINSGQLPAAVSSIPEPWQRLIRACLVVDPEKRVKSCAEASAILAGKAQPDEVTRVEPPKREPKTKPALKPEPEPKPEPKPKPLKPVAWIILGSVGGIIAGLLVVLFGTSVLSTSNEREEDRQEEQKAQIAEPEMVFVQGGTFTMGCTAEQGNDCDDDEKPAHRVTVSSFQIGKYEVTQAQWKAVMGSNPSSFKGNNRPVEKVSWNDAQEFISRLNAATGKNYRLPTEAEWEYAARGGNRSQGYKYSGSNNLFDVAWFDGNSNNQTHPVGTKKANELGIYDMNGNVYEWCQDWYGYYAASAQHDPTGASSGSARVLRGGYWNSYNASYCRVAIRFGDTPSYSNGYLGFRLVLP